MKVKEYRSMEQFHKVFFPEAYERKRREGLSPKELGREDADKILEKVKI